VKTASTQLVSDERRSVTLLEGNLWTRMDAVANSNNAIRVSGQLFGDPTLDCWQETGPLAFRKTAAWCGVVILPTGAAW
jgi:hypothetical protein